MDATLTEALQRLALTDFASKLTDLGVNDASDVLALNDLDLGGVGLSTVQVRRLQRELKNKNQQKGEAFASNDPLASNDPQSFCKDLEIDNLETPGGPEQLISDPPIQRISDPPLLRTRSMARRRTSTFWKSQLNRPLRLIFIRHGESEANVDRTLTATVPDHMLHLTSDGRKQALDAGKRLKELIGDEPTKFVVSPYVRTRETFNGIKQAWAGKKVTMKTDVRLREQEFGNYDSPDMKKLHKEKTKYGKFYYRFPDGESPADCYDRASSFFETMYRSWEDNAATNQVIVGHGMMILSLLMRLMRFSIEDWENMDSLQNCEFVVLSHPPDDGKYVIDFTWAGGQPRSYKGLREKVAVAGVEIWDGNPDAPLLVNAKG